MVTCNKIPLAQHVRWETKHKLNTVTLREALLAHTNSGDSEHTDQARPSRLKSSRSPLDWGWCHTGRHSNMLNWDVWSWSLVFYQERLNARLSVINYWGLHPEHCLMQLWPHQLSQNFHCSLLNHWKDFMNPFIRNAWVNHRLAQSI